MNHAVIRADLCLMTTVTKDHQAQNTVIFSIFSTMIRTLFLLLTIVAFATNARAQDTTKLDIADNGDYYSFRMLDNVINNYRIIFTGENHVFRKSNYRLELKMMKYLYDKAGFRHFIMEFGFSRGWLVDKYVQTGDTSLFKVLSDYSYQEYALLYKGLYEFNKTLPDTAKIRIHSIDIERSLSTPLKVMDLLIPKNRKIPASIALTIESIHSLAVMSDDEQRKAQQKNKEDFRTGAPFSLKRSLKFILQDLDSNKAAFKELLGNDYPVFYKIEQGLRAEMDRSTYNDMSAVQGYLYRERFMHESLRELAAEFPTGKFYGQFGRCHTSLETEDVWCGFYAFTTLATRLDSDSLFKGKVLAIAQYYPNGSAHEKGVIDRDGVKPLLKISSPDGLTLIHHRDVVNDTARLKNRFQYLIINQADHRMDNMKVDSTKPPVDYSTYESTIFLEGHYGLLGVNLNALNSTLFGLDPSAISFTSPLTVVGGSYTQLEDGVFYTFMYSAIRNTEIGFSDSLYYGLKGGSFRFRVGGDFVRSKWLDVGPFFGYGYQRLVLTRDEILAGPVGSGFFGATNRLRTSVTNPSIFLEAGVSLKLRLKFFFFGGTAGWQLDVSKKGWRENGSYVSGGPKTSQSGMVIMGQAGFYF